MRFIFFTLLLLPLAVNASDSDLAKKKLERACKKVEQHIVALLNAQSGKDLIADNNNLNKAQLLLSSHKGMGCSQLDISKTISKHPKMNPIKKF